MNGKSRTIRGKLYRPTVIKITGRYPDGRPKECVMVHDDQTVDVQESTEFMISFLPSKCVVKSKS